MKFFKIIITGGISLFNPHNLYGKKTRELDIFTFDRTNPKLKDNDDENQILNQWIKKMENLNRQNYEHEISAEYSLLYALKNENKLTDGINITIFYTPIINKYVGGKFSAELLKKIIEKDFNAEVKLIQLEDFSVNERKKMNQAISNFMKSLANELKNSDKLSTFFAPIGGYKVITSFGYITGSFYGFPTGYLHEDNQVLQIIPPVPVELDRNFIENNKDILRKLVIEDIIPKNAKTLKLKEYYPFLVEFVDDYVALNVLGQFLLTEKYPQFFDYKIYIKNMPNNQKEKKFIYNEISHLLKKINDESNNKNILHHEGDLNIKLSDNFHIYKGASNSQLVCRLLWKLYKEKKELFIAKAWIAHEKYEKDIKKQKKIQNYINSSNYKDKTYEYYEQINKE